MLLSDAKYTEIVVTPMKGGCDLGCQLLYFGIHNLK